jgi:phosphorylated CTD-interacting factor 1
VELACGKVKVEANETHYRKLRAMYAKTAGTKHVRDEEAFERAAFCVLARYASMQGTHYKSGNMQASIPPAVFDALYERFDVTHEMFASPLNARCDTFCSASDATDRAFGSKGSAFDFLPYAGSYEANPPFDESVIAALGSHLERVLSASKAPLSFCVIIPRWTESQAWLRIAKSLYNTSSTTLEAKEHAFVSGGAGSRVNQLTASAAATSVFFLQNKAGSKKWPTSQDAIESIRLAFALPAKNHDADDEDADASWDPDAPLPGPSTRRRSAGQSSFVYGHNKSKRSCEEARVTVPAAKKQKDKKTSGKYSASFFRD